MASASGWAYRGKEVRTKVLKVSFNWRRASAARVSNTIDDLPEPDTPVKMVMLRLGMRNDTSLRLFSRAPRISMYSWGMVNLFLSIELVCRNIRPWFQRTAFFTSAAIFFSSAAVSAFSAKEVGHMAPSSRFAASLKPNVAYLALNLCALWKKQTTLPSLVYAGIPYQVLGERAGALALMRAWSRSAMARSVSGISAIFASRSLSPSALRGPRRAAA